MKIELITREIARQKYLEREDIAFAIAAANDILPFNCNAPECILFMTYALLTSTLEPDAVCIFIDDLPAELICDTEITPGVHGVCKLCAKNVADVYIKNDSLHIKYFDGVIEEYIYHKTIGAWQFKGKNISILVPSTSGN